MTERTEGIAQARTTPVETMSITASNGVRFIARILRKGDRYGLEDALTWHMSKPAVEFYDTRYMHTELGQFVSRYFIETLLEGSDRYGLATGGLNLDAGVDDWSIDAESMYVVRRWLAHEVNA